MDKKICAVYARVSTDMQAESLTNQVDYAMEYIRRLGTDFYIGETCIYQDFDKSGYYTRFLDRPAIQMALQDAMDKKFDVIVFKEISRISRDQAEHIEIVTRFTQNNVRVIAINDNVDSDRPETLDLLGIHSVTSEMESRRISSRVSAARRSKARRGSWVGEPPIGYIVDPEKKSLEVDDRFAQIPKMIFRMYTQEGLGTFKIAEQLNEKGLLSKNDNLWSRTTVNRVLQNPAYVGDLVFGKTRNTLVRRYDDNKYKKSMGRKKIDENDWIVIKDTHPALVDRAVFEMAQKIMGGRAKQNPRRTLHPLTGVLVCAKCGAGMICQKRRYQTREYRYYCCVTAFKYGRKFCDQSNIRADEIENAVHSFLLDYLNRFKDVPVSVVNDNKVIKKQLNKKERELKKANDALKRVFAADLSEQQLNDVVNHWRSEISRLEAELAELLIEEKSEEDKKDRMAMVDDYLRIIRDLDEGDLDKKRLLFHELLSRIIVDGHDVKEIELKYDMSS